MPRPPSGSLNFKLQVHIGEEAIDNSVTTFCISRHEHQPVPHRLCRGPCSGYRTFPVKLVASLNVWWTRYISTERRKILPPVQPTRRLLPPLERLPRPQKTIALEKETRFQAVCMIDSTHDQITKRACMFFILFYLDADHLPRLRSICVLFISLRHQPKNAVHGCTSPRKRWRKHERGRRWRV